MRKELKFSMAFGIVVGGAFFSGCATIFNWSAHPKVRINCDQPGAKVCVFNRGKYVTSFSTPGEMRLESSPSLFRRSSYAFEFSKPGYETACEKRVARMSGWYWGNIAIGGLVGMFLVDPISGSMYRISGAPVWASLEQEKQANGGRKPVSEDGFAVKRLSYDVDNHKGVIALEVKGNEFVQARDWARKYIETMANDKNVALRAGEVPTGGTFYLGKESVSNNTLEIEFEIE